MKIDECGCGGNAENQEWNEREMENYMFFGNLKTIKMTIDKMMQMNPNEVNALLTDGHDWAADHVATSKDDIQEVADFLVNALSKKGQVHSHSHMSGMPVFVHTFESFTHINEAKKTKKKDQDGDGDSDFADVKIAQYKAGGVPKKKAVSMSRKFNK